MLDGQDAATFSVKVQGGTAGSFVVDRAYAWIDRSCRGGAFAPKSISITVPPGPDAESDADTHPQADAARSRPQRRRPRPPPSRPHARPHAGADAQPAPDPTANGDSQTRRVPDANAARPHPDARPRRINRATERSPVDPDGTARRDGHATAKVRIRDPTPPRPRYGRAAAGHRRRVRSGRHG